MRNLNELRALLKTLKIITQCHFSDEESQADLNSKFIEEMETGIERGYEHLVTILLRNNRLSDEEEDKDSDSLRLVLLSQLKGTMNFQ